jgi:RHS repeat-associated protein
VYLPFGETWTHDGDVKHSPKYNSQELDKETNYYFYNARHYDPEVGRFVTPDPVKDGAFNTQGWNRYSYVLNNPIIYKDPTGLFEIHAHDEGTGHVGASVLGKSYDFGRYKGKYNGALYTGPNVVKMGNKNTQKAYMQEKEGAVYKFDVSTELDKIVDKKFASKMAEYEKQFPDDVKKKMPKGSQTLSPNERYAKSDWGFTGPNCVTFTEDTLREAMSDVIKNSKNKKLVEEAIRVNKALDKVFDYTNTPGGVKSNLEELAKEKNLVKIESDYSKKKDK